MISLNRFHGLAGKRFSAADLNPIAPPINQTSLVMHFLPSMSDFDVGRWTLSVKRLLLHHSSSWLQGFSVSASQLFLPRLALPTKESTHFRAIPAAFHAAPAARGVFARVEKKPTAIAASRTPFHAIELR